MIPPKCDYAGHSEQPIAGFCVSKGFHKTLVCSPWHRRIFPEPHRPFRVVGHYRAVSVAYRQVKAYFPAISTHSCRPQRSDAERERYFRRNFLYATERGPWHILEAFAERMRRLGASRSSRRNGILQEVPLPFGFHSLKIGSVHQKI